VIDAGAQRFIEALGLFFEDAGIPRIGGRLLGLLVLAEQPLSLDAIARTLGVSRASVSTNSRLLIYAGMVERVSLPGDRRDYYQFAPHGWESAIQTDIKAARRLGALSAEALAGVAPEHAMVSRRLGETAAFYAFLEQELAAMLERWRSRAAAGVDGAAARPG